MTEATTTQETQEETTYCTVHPTVEAVLRCNKCDRPMCTRCAVRTPVGYRCRQCVTAQQDIYFTAEMRDYVIAGVVAFLVSAVVGGVLVRIGFLILTLLLSAPAGGLISEIVWRLSGRRRGRYSWIVVPLCAALGALPVLALTWVQLGRMPPVMFLLNVALYAGIAAVAAASRFRLGIRL